MKPEPLRPDWNRIEDQNIVHLRRVSLINCANLNHLLSTSRNLPPASFQHR